MSKPLVTIIVPTFNSEKTLQLCLESIRKQTYKNIEVIVVDNYSTDSTVSVAKKYDAKVIQVRGERARAKNIELKNVILVNKAIYDIEGITVKISDEGTASKISGEGVELNTVTVDSLGKFEVVKMDIEGAENRAFTGDWINYVMEIAVELHGKENIELIPNILRAKGFRVRFMKEFDLAKNTLKNILTHPLSFIKAEIRTKVMLNYLLGRYYVPALTSNEMKIVYAKRG
ncbi:glycosyltransferase [Pyrobaculum sp.]|uniref:glycosyltransferase n=1 Tax=Pyrobaculum sp. TaxID=2004705 RepID=UPI00316F97BD